jgi:hypothetical protein
MITEKRNDLNIDKINEIKIMKIIGNLLSANKFLQLLTTHCYIKRFIECLANEKLTITFDADLCYLKFANLFQITTQQSFIHYISSVDAIWLQIIETLVKFSLFFQLNFQV